LLDGVAADVGAVPDGKFDLFSHWMLRVETMVSETIVA
jgi:hypothetical protein